MFEFREEANLRSITLDLGNLTTATMDLSVEAKSALIASARRNTEMRSLIRDLPILASEASSSGRTEAEVEEDYRKKRP